MEGWGFTTKLCPRVKANNHYGVDAHGQVAIDYFKGKSNVLATFVVFIITSVLKGWES